MHTTCSHPNIAASLIFNRIAVKLNLLSQISMKVTLNQRGAQNRIVLLGKVKADIFGDFSYSTRL